MDETDRKILEELQRDGRVSFRELGRRIGLSGSAVIERVRRMEAEEVIVGYAALVDERKVGFPVKALTYMFTNFNNPDPHISDKIVAIPEVLRQWSITGDSDYCIEVVARSVENLEHVLAQLARLGKLSTSVALSWKEKRGCPIERSAANEEKVY
ncbi:MAG: Lrp/AsnC family transcriptional regulator [Synergistales bacterium]|nr:Lrp/AsnC family transcriptional regulator [Synergistales bacterium]